MKREGQLPRILIFLLISLLLVSCTAPSPVHTLNPLAEIPTYTTIADKSTLTPTTIPATSTPTSLPPPVTPEFPTGIFFHQHAPASFCVFQFNQDGTYAYFWLVSSVDVTHKKPYASGTYKTDGNLYIETSTDIPECPTPATYTWTYDGENLTFQAVGADPCADRQRTYETPLLYTKVK